MARMIGMTGFIILIAKKTHPRGRLRSHRPLGGAAEGSASVFFISLVFLHIWAIILVIRMISLAIRMKTPINLIILALMRKPD